jgi:DNA-binding NarL/FixJ family response regulator
MAGTGRRLDVVVGDRQPIFVEGLLRVLEGHARVLGVADDHGGLARILDRCRPDVVLVGLPGPRAAEKPWLAALAARRSTTRVLVLTESVDGARLAACTRAGVRSVASRAIGAEELRDGIGKVAGGQAFLGPEAVDAMLGWMARPSRSEPVALTARELEVLRLLADGRNAPAIAAALVLEQTTVRTHLKNIFEKLDVSNQAEAVAQGMRRGLFI